MSSLDSTIVATALPTIRHALHTRINWASWTIVAYQLGLVVSMPVGGRIADQFGRKRVFIGAAVLFTAASLLCGLADNIAFLILVRVMQAIGGGAFMPSANGMVAEAFGRDRDRALGLFSTIFPLGALTGPIVGGVLITEWSWRGIFLVNVPIGVVFTVLGMRYLPPSPVGGQSRARADLIGALLLGGTVLGTMLSVTHYGDASARLLSVGCILPLAASALCAAAFVKRCSSAPHPLIPIEVLRRRPVLVMNGINFVWGACAIGFGALVPLFAEQRYGLSPLASGTLLTARALAEVLSAMAASLLIRLTGYRLPMVIGFALIATGFVLLALHPPLFAPYTWLALAAGVTGVGIGVSAPAANNATLDLSPGNISVISGMRGACRQSGAVIGVALTTAVVARSTHQAVTLGKSFLVLGILLALMIPLVVPVTRPAHRPERDPVDAGRTRTFDG